MTPNHHPQDWEPIRSKIHDHLKTHFGINDTSGLETFVLLQRTAHMIRQFDTQLDEETEVSGPRWRLLLGLYIDEKMGNTAGLTPTAISHAQRVSKNTISVLLRGLEAQGLVQRTLDTTDLRTFRIQLTPAGREYLDQTVPIRMNNLNHLLSGFEPEEQAQLTALLEKLQRALQEHCTPLCKHYEASEDLAEEEPISEE